MEENQNNVSNLKTFGMEHWKAKEIACSRILENDESSESTLFETK